MFLIFGVTQLGVALGSRARPGSLANPFLLVAVGAALSLQVAGVYLPALRALLGMEPLPLTDLAIAAAASIWMKRPCQVWHQTAPVRVLTKSMPTVSSPRRACRV
ncbi:cation transporting ATPase C-terminal domain-containing protein [Streptomyces sp. HNM0645]|nr:cation transporting ATPase C-terminal domain-containing protein [Streptomyces sp. HNM0645]MDI9887600.1 cation transporting ATPase C-terminal domain-containing protein [Streptomyces sp. HNM0645]